MFLRLKTYANYMGYKDKPQEIAINSRYITSIKPITSLYTKNGANLKPEITAQISLSNEVSWGDIQWFINARVPTGHEPLNFETLESFDSIVSQLTIR